MRQRVARLVDAGVMQIVAVTNPLQLGFTRQAMIGIKAEGNLEPVVDALRAMDEVDYVVSRRALSTSWSRWSAPMTTTCSTC